MTVATQADIEALLQVGFDNQPEPKVTAVLVACQRAVEAQAGQPFDADTGLVATMGGWGVATLRLPRWPVSAVASVVVDGVTMVEGTDFVVDPAGYLPRVPRGNLWWSEPRGIVVTYDAGWADEDSVPALVRDLVASVAARVWQAGIAFSEADAPAGVTQETLGMYSVTYGEFTHDGSAAVTLTEEELDRARKLRRDRMLSVQT